MMTEADVGFARGTGSLNVAATASTRLSYDLTLRGG
jgi:hypothetical protein